MGTFCADFWNKYFFHKIDLKKPPGLPTEILFSHSLSITSLPITFK